MSIDISQNIYRRIVEFIRTSNSPIPILRYKRPENIKIGDVITIKSIYNGRVVNTLKAEVVDIKEYDADKDQVPYDDLKPIYSHYLRQLYKLKRVVIVYVKPISF